MTRDVCTNGSRSGTGRLITLFLLSWTAAAAGTEVSPLKRIIAASDQKHRCEDAALVAADDPSPETIPGQASPARVAEDDETQPMEIPADGLVVIETAAVEGTPEAALGASTPATAPANDNPKTKRRRGKKKRLAKLAAAAAAEAAKAAPPPSPATAPAASGPATETPKVYNTPSGLPPPPIAPPSGPRRPLILIPRPEAIAAPVVEPGPQALSLTPEEAGPYAAARPPAFTARVWNSLVKQVTQRFGDSKAQLEERLLIGKLGHLLRAACSPVQAPITPLKSQEPEPSFTLSWKWDRLILKERHSLLELWIDNGKFVVALPLRRDKKVAAILHHRSQMSLDIPRPMQRALEETNPVSAMAARSVLRDFFANELQIKFLHNIDRSVNSSLLRNVADLQPYGLIPTTEIPDNFFEGGVHMLGPMRNAKGAIENNCIVSFGARAGQIWVRARCKNKRDSWLRFPAVEIIGADGLSDGALKNAFLRHRSLAEWKIPAQLSGDLTDSEAASMLSIFAGDSSADHEFAPLNLPAGDLLLNDGIFAGSGIILHELPVPGLTLSYVGDGVNVDGESALVIELRSTDNFKARRFMPADIKGLRFKLIISKTKLYFSVLSSNYQTNKAILFPESYLHTSGSSDEDSPSKLEADLISILLGRMTFMERWIKKDWSDYVFPTDGAGNASDYWRDINRLEELKAASANNSAPTPTEDQEQ